ncbi:DCC1-like thiol-disulfide oxidoreductase family protein [Streptomyces sp. NPDC013172]|uniref:thiol-disulfide oxidoreductase DCC family protein n=1 Tax=Streptomyces sp. NPDC013172 TaxID=3155009 RepID=UPI0033EF92BB
MSAVPTTADRDARRVPVRGLTVLYDAECVLCTHLRDWLARQPQLVPLTLLPAGSDEARTRFPDLDHSATFDEVTVVGDAGQVYRETAAWIVVLWALREQRPLAHRLSTPAGAKLARGAVLAAAWWRGGQGDGRSAFRRQDMDRGGAKRLGEGWRSGDGWAYEPGIGWIYDPPGCAGGVCTTG